MQFRPPTDTKQPSACKAEADRSADVYICEYKSESTEWRWWSLERSLYNWSIA